MSKYGLLWLVLAWLVAGCVKHVDMPQDFTPISTFSGRLLVVSPGKRFQVEVDWQGSAEKGQLRLTHGLSGRIVDVAWQGQQMRWRDHSQSQQWYDLSEKELLDMGVLLPPWTLAKVFAGDMPKAMHTKDNRTWQGVWDGVSLKVKWASRQQRVEITDMKHGRRAVVIFNE
ncbi:MAG: hypothetical protein L3J61_00995 [Ghiorsea sp.]|nr:hypothetical protein [Ghiorsea sp.]